MEDDGSLGGKFWLSVVGIVVAIGIGGILLFSLIGAVWYAWGFVGALVFVLVVALGYGWIYDRRHKRREEDFAA
jgi:uncharacterized membrane protein